MCSFTDFLLCFRCISELIRIYTELFDRTFFIYTELFCVYTVLVLLRPLAGLGGGSLRVRYDELEREITARIEDYQTLHENELESIIADSTAAYISEQAAHLGLTCRAEVRCEVRDGTPQPASAAMDIPYDARLAAAIADDLGIPAEKQSWQGGEAP